MKRWFTILLLVVAGYSCIPIEDNILPQIERLELRDSVYFYRDTLSVRLSVRDETTLDTLRLRISKNRLNPLDQNPWVLDSIIPLLGGRRYSDTLLLEVPAFVNTGSYNVQLTTQDAGSNSVIRNRNFLILSDTLSPRFQDLSLSLEQNPDGTYSTCRGEAFNVSGLVTDNLALTRVGFRVNGSIPSFDQVSGNSFNLADLSFNNALVTPANASDGIPVTFTLVAVDTFNNRSTFDFTLIPDCDDLSPEIQLGTTRPNLLEGNEVNITQGGRFRINNLFIEDNRALATASVFFNISQRDPELFSEVDLQGASQVNLADSVALLFDIPEFAPIGQIYELLISATDTTGLTSLPLSIRLTVVEDDPPSIVLTNTLVNGEEVRYSEDEAVEVRADDVLALEGKIEELNELVRVRLAILNGASGAVVSQFVFNNPDNALAVTISDLYPEGGLRIPTTAEPGEIYLLQLRAVDNKDQVNEQLFQFLVIE
jgi:hypothetical protein